MTAYQAAQNMMSYQLDGLQQHIMIALQLHE